jgi:hypothetical protein
MRPTFVTTLLAALLTACAASLPESTAEACPVCGKPVADGPEVRLWRAGEEGPGTRYRCFICPLMTGLSGSAWIMRAASGLDAKPVTLRSDGQHVASDPPTAVALALPVTAGAECLDVHRVFADEDEFRRYMVLHPELPSAAPRHLQDVIAEHRR